jgi:group I intron endonuclease
MDIKEGIVYLLTNIHNQNQYVGQSSKGLKYFTEKYWGSGKLIRRAIAKYGQDSFVKEILWYKQGCTKEELDAAETSFIEKLSPIYNIAERAGGGNLGAEWQKRVREGIMKLYSDLEYAALASERSRRRWDSVSSTDRAGYARKGWSGKTAKERAEIAAKVQCKISQSDKSVALKKYYSALSKNEQEDRKENIRQGIQKTKNRNIKVLCVELDTLFDTIGAASRYFHVDHTGIKRALDNPEATSAGYHWRRIPLSSIDTFPSPYSIED